MVSTVQSNDFDVSESERGPPKQFEDAELKANINLILDEDHYDSEANDRNIKC